MAAKDSERALLTTAKTAKRLGYTVQHTRLLIRQNKLSAQKVGRDWLIFDDALRSFERTRVNNRE